LFKARNLEGEKIGYVIHGKNLKTTKVTHFTCNLANRSKKAVSPVKYTFTFLMLANYFLRMQIF
jgi:hypothetical protein